MHKFNFCFYFFLTFLNPSGYTNEPDSTSNADTDSSPTFAVINKKPKIATKFSELRKIRRIRRRLIESQFRGFPDPDAENNRFCQSNDNHLFLKAYIEECEKIKKKSLNYNTTAYVACCDDDVIEILKSQFETVFDVKKNCNV